MKPAMNRNMDEKALYGGLNKKDADQNSKSV